MILLSGRWLLHWQLRLVWVVQRLFVVSVICLNVHGDQRATGAAF